MSLIRQRCEDMARLAMTYHTKKYDSIRQHDLNKLSYKVRETWTMSVLDG